MGIDGVGGSAAIQFDSISKLIGTGDMESVLLAFGVERAQNMESAVKAKIGDMRARNGEIQELQQAMQYFRAAKPKDDDKGKSFQINGKDVSPTDPEFLKHKATMEANGLFNNIEMKDGKVKLTKDGAYEDLIKNAESKIDELTSNDQLDMITLQSMVSKQNNAIEMVSNLTSKFAQLNDKIVGNMR